MGISFTTDQQRVIDLRNSNILVSAAAGSGKTAVLVERIVNMVCDKASPMDIDRLLVVTFTKAAAQEMKERIREALEAKLEEDPEDENLERQITLLHNSLITTIDSFCLYIVKNHFHEVSLDPSMRVTDEGEEKLIQKQVMEELIENKYREEEDSFLSLVEFLCQGKSDRELEEQILKLYEFSQSHPFPKEWLEERKGDFTYSDEKDFYQRPLGRFLQDYVRKVLSGVLRDYQKALALCEEEDGPYMYKELLEREEEYFSRLVSLTDIEKMTDGIREWNFDRLLGKKDPLVDQEKKDRAKELRDKAKKAVSSLHEILFTGSWTEKLAIMEECSGNIKTLLELTILFTQELLNYKREKKLLSFSDIEHYALQILLKRNEDGSYGQSEVAKEYSEYFGEILIDEYQDSNLVQEYILKAVSGEPRGRFNRFMVGDVKQSIYRFRLARPELFMEKYGEYDSASGDRIRIDLSQNFRSRKQVLEIVNHMFEQLMYEDTGGIVYDDAQALHTGAIYPENPDSFGELLLLEENDFSDKEEKISAEGRMIGQRIQELLKEYRIVDKKSKEERLCEYKDIVILLRSNADYDEILRDTLENMGIPAVITSKTGYFAAEEIRELLAFLMTLDNPLTDLPLYATMHSVFGNFTEEEIVQIRLYAEGKKKHSFLWKDVNQYSGQENELGKKCRSFVERIEGYRRVLTYVPIRKLLDRLCMDYDYITYLEALPGGGKRKKNVEMLLEKASAFEKTSFHGLSHFVRYINQLKKYEIDLSAEGSGEESVDAVRIMSIHKSKGLEFPITFVSGLGKKFNLQDLNQRILMDMDYGIACDFVNVETRRKQKTIGRKLLSLRLKQEMLSEELRILYVALTRAREKLIMTGVLKDVENTLGQCLPEEKQISYTDFMNASSFLDYILPTYDRNAIQTRVLNREELDTGEIKKNLDQMLMQNQLHFSESKADWQLVKQIEDNLSYAYPYKHLQNLYTKTSVSELKIAAMEEKDEAAFQLFENKEFAPHIPRFAQEEEEAKGTERGNAYHKLMEWLDFDAVYPASFQSIDIYEDFCRAFSEETIQQRVKEFLSGLVARHRMTKEYGQLISLNKIVHFLKSSLAFRMWKADKRGELYREQPFVYGITADRIRKEFGREEKVLIQGIVDAFFIEKDEIVVLDYKTDRVLSGEDLVIRYETQLAYYQEALSNIWQMKVKEKVLYSFSLEEVIEIK